MITVKEILERPLFKMLRVAAGSQGLCNVVRSTGFLEWETGTRIINTFPENEFVITTLSAVKDDPAAMEQALATLIQCRVAAIAIKSVHVKFLPDSIRALAEETGTPVLFFDELYVDELLFDLKTAILENDAKYQRSIINKLLSEPGSSPKKRRSLALQLDSAFQDTLVFCAFASEQKGPFPELQDLALDEPHIQEALHRKAPESAAAPAITEETPLMAPDCRYTFLPYRDGLLFFHTSKTPLPTNPRQIQRFLLPYLSPGKEYHIGISLQNKELECITQSIQEALYANTSCRMNQVPFAEFSATGLDRLLCHASESEWSKRYFSDLMAKITTSGDSPETLLKTLLIYVHCGGNVVLTSKNMYQHSNTIRYRLSKIQELWGTHSTLDFDAQAILFARLYFLYRCT